MARKDRINMPMSGAGITRYFDEYKSKLELMPNHVVFIAVAVIALVLLLHIYGNSLL